MVLTDESLDSMLAEIGEHRVVIEDTLVPNGNPEFFQQYHIMGDSVLAPDPEYFKLLGDITEVSPSLFEEVFLNSFGWGNNNDPDLPVAVTVFKGVNGSVVRIEDSGVGFDFSRKIEEMRKGIPFYQLGGRGLFRLDKGLDGSLECYASYEGKGNVVNIRVPKV
jgi:hypothetical protein